jgi:hypothetical protein
MSLLMESVYAQRGEGMIRAAHSERHEFFSTPMIFRRDSGLYCIDSMEDRKHG